MSLPITEERSSTEGCAMKFWVSVKMQAQALAEQRPLKYCMTHMNYSQERSKEESSGEER